MAPSAHQAQPRPQGGAKGAGKAAKGAQRCRGHPRARQDAHAPARLRGGIGFPGHSTRLRGSGELRKQEASGVISKEILKAKPLRAKERAASNSIGAEQNKNHRKGRFNIESNPIPDFLLLILQQPADGGGEGAVLPPCSCPPHIPWCPPHIPGTRGGGTAPCACPEAELCAHRHTSTPQCDRAGVPWHE